MTGLRLLIETRGRGLLSYPGVPQALLLDPSIFNQQKQPPLGAGFWTAEKDVHLVVKVTRSQRRLYSAPRVTVLFDRLIGQTWSQLFCASKEWWVNRLNSHPIKSPLPYPPKSLCLEQARRCSLPEDNGSRSRSLSWSHGCFAADWRYMS